MRYFWLLALLLPLQLFGQIYDLSNTSLDYTDTLGIAFLQTAGASYCSEYQIVHDKFVDLGSEPSSAKATLYNALVDSLVQNDSLWYGLDVFIVHAVHDSVAALVNWRDTSDNVTINNGGTFTAYEGFTGDHSNSAYVGWGWNPRTDADSFQLNDASIGFYCRTDVSENYFDIGAASGDTIILLGNYGGNLYGKLNNDDQVVNAVADDLGLNMIVRSDANTVTMYKNNSAEGTEGSNTATQIPNLEMFSLAYSSAGSPAGETNRQHSMVFAGKALDSNDRAALQEEFENYMDENNKGVIN